ncbi:MAG: hypothetical protein IPM12_09655 [Flavobacteriales bacterium]|nr:hypothetical protein [Flavobacteriales bacterium]
MKWKLIGYLITAFLIVWLAIGIRASVKDSRSEIVNSFGSADRVELRLLNHGPGLLCDAELRSSLMSVLRTLEPTNYPPRQSCSVVHIVAWSSTGQEIDVLDLLTTNNDQGIFGMPGEQNYSSAQIPNLLRLMRVKHPELGFRFFNAQGRCE